MRLRPSARAGFTLAEVAITLLIVSMGLVLVLQGLLTAEMSAAETYSRKVARELAQLTLGRVEAGLYWEDLDGDGRGGMHSGSYAEQGYEDFSYEMVLGEDQFQEDDSSRRGEGFHDSWQHEREREERAERDSKKDEEEVEQPFEKVRIKVFFPKLGQRPNTFVLERWIPWEQVYGAKDEDGQKSGASAGAGS